MWTSPTTRPTVRRLRRDGNSDSRGPPPSNELVDGSKEKEKEKEKEKGGQGS